MFKTILLSITMMSVLNGACVPAVTLEELGFTPIADPVAIENPPVCQSALTGKKSCVDLDQFKVFMDAFLKEAKEKRESRYNKMIAALKKSITKVNELKTKFATKDKLKPKQQEKLVKLESIAAMMGDVDAAVKKVEDGMKACDAEQNLITFGTFCLLITDEGTKRVAELESTTETNTKPTGKKRTNGAFAKPQLSSNVTFKIKPDNAKKGVTACKDLINAGCTIKTLLDAIKELKNNSTNASRGDKCSAKLNTCVDSTTAECTTEINNSFTSNMNAFEGDMVSDDDLAGVDTEGAVDVKTLGLVSGTNGSFSYSVTDDGADVIAVGSASGLSSGVTVFSALFYFVFSLLI